MPNNRAAIKKKKVETPELKLKAMRTSAKGPSTQVRGIYPKAIVSIPNIEALHTLQMTGLWTRRAL